MKNQNLAIPLALLTAGVIALFAPGLDNMTKGVAFCVAILIAGLSSVLSRTTSPRRLLSGFKVKWNEVSFFHHELPVAEREPTTPETEKIYNEAKGYFHNGDFDKAAATYAKAFSTGGNYWPAKVNEGASFQGSGDFEKALETFEYVALNSELPKYRSQALQNTGVILMTLAEMATEPQQIASLRASAYEKLVAADATDRTIFSLNSLREACKDLGKKKEEQRYTELLHAHPDYPKLLKAHSTIET